MLVKFFFLGKDVSKVDINQTSNIEIKIKKYLNPFSQKEVISLFSSFL